MSNLSTQCAIPVKPSSVAYTSLGDKLYDRLPSSSPEFLLYQRDIHYAKVPDDIAVRLPELDPAE